MKRKEQAWIADLLICGGEGACLSEFVIFERGEYNNGTRQWNTTFCPPRPLSIRPCHHGRTPLPRFLGVVLCLAPDYLCTAGSEELVCATFPIAPNLQVSRLSGGIRSGTVATMYIHTSILIATIHLLFRQKGLMSSRKKIMTLLRTIPRSVMKGCPAFLRHISKKGHLKKFRSCLYCCRSSLSDDHRYISSRTHTHTQTHTSRLEHEFTFVSNSRIE
jgi:hypothetical protein